MLKIKKVGEMFSGLNMRKTFLVLLILTILVKMNAYATHIISVGNNELPAKHALYREEDPKRKIIRAVYLSEPTEIKVGDYTIPFHGSSVFDVENPDDLAKNIYTHNRVAFSKQREGLKKNTITFYPSGDIQSGYLSSVVNVTVGSNNISIAPKYSGHRPDISFYTNGKIKSLMLYENTKISVGKNNFIFKANVSDTASDIYFYANQSVKSGAIATVAKARVGDNVLFIRPERALPYGNVAFYENGNVKHAFLEKQTEINVLGNTLVFCDRIGHFADIWFYESGNVKKAAVESDTLVSFGENKIKMKGKEWIQFYPSEKIRRAYIASLSEIKLNGDRLILESSEAGFYESGELMWGKAAKDFEYFKSVSEKTKALNKIKKGKWVYFHKNEKGTFEYLSISENGICEDDIPFRILGADVLIKKGSIVGNRYENAIFREIEPFADILFMEHVIARRGELVAVDTLRKEIRLILKAKES